MHQRRPIKQIIHHHNYTYNPYPGDPGPRRIPQHKATKQILRIVGIIVLIIGVIVLMIGISKMSNNSLDDESFNETSTGMFTTFAGVAFLMFGGMLLYYSVVGRVASYFADEYSPAIETGTEAFGAGITRGIQRGGGLKFQIESTDQQPVSSARQQKEVIKIKCRSCGYLETEDAEFCSKCGNKI